MKRKKNLEIIHLGKILSNLHEYFQSISDPRATLNKQFDSTDVVMGTIAMLFFQEPSLAAYQNKMKEAKGKHNLSSLFGVKNIPSDSQFRRILDKINHEEIAEGVTHTVRYLQKTPAWKRFKWKNGRYLVMIDATETFRSEKIHCSKCLTFKHKDGRVEYAHKALVAVLVHPDLQEVIPLACEEIRNTDGACKQDCEMNAAKRLLPKLAKTFSHLDMVIIGDGLFSKSPMLSLCNSLKLNYIFVAKPGDHKSLEVNLAGLRKIKALSTVEIDKDGGRQILFEFSKDKLPVADCSPTEAYWFFAKERGKTGQKKYQNSWVTNLKPCKNNIAEMVSAARARWKIENETFNALKRHGYHLEHNYGHGKENLPINIIHLNLLAFLIHQILYLLEKLFLLALDQVGTKRDFYEKLKWTANLVFCSDWTMLIGIVGGYIELKPLAPD